MINQKINSAAINTSGTTTGTNYIAPIFPLDDGVAPRRGLGSGAINGGAIAGAYTQGTIGAYSVNVAASYTTTASLFVGAGVSGYAALNVGAFSIGVARLNSIGTFVQSDAKFLSESANHIDAVYAIRGTVDAGAFVVGKTALTVSSSVVGVAGVLNTAAASTISNADSMAVSGSYELAQAAQNTVSANYVLANAGSMLVSSTHVDSSSDSLTASGSYIVSQSTGYTVAATHAIGYSSGMATAAAAASAVSGDLATVGVAVSGLAAQMVTVNASIQTIAGQYSVASAYNVSPASSLAASAVSVNAAANNLSTTASGVSSLVSDLAAISSSYTGVAGLADFSGVAYTGVAEMRAPAAAYVVAKYDILATNQAAASVVGLASSNQSSIVQLSGETRITTASGRVMYPTDVAVSAGDSAVGFYGNFSLSNQDDFFLVKIGDSVELDFYGVIYNFVIDTREITRSTSFDGTITKTMNVSIVSPAIAYTAAGGAAKITKVWDAPILASSIANELLGSVNWTAVDWEIPAYRFGVSEAYPLDVVSNLAKSAGAVLEADELGSFSVRSKYPVTLYTLQSSTATINISDTSDILSISERFLPNPTFNAIQISDTATSYSDAAEFTAVSDTEGSLSVYLTPWRSNYSVRSTNQAVAISGGLDGFSQLTETVEFKEGVGNVSKPIYTLDAIVWDGDNLGAVTYARGDNQITAVGGGYGLADVTFTVRFKQYALQANAGTAAQILVEAV